ncbi:hypothetical protein PVAP13_3KG020627 [Panicum virgatum]|uniref:Uncharacterized protein n=1 Tax=Panicum virgatum TaxID=38727 RepID=A0A8T0UK43_PANVG|nr:hypothetical protein PVAP13_3KG020627 [Panicum virgatum]
MNSPGVSSSTGWPWPSSSCASLGGIRLWRAGSVALASSGGSPTVSSTAGGLAPPRPPTPPIHAVGHGVAARDLPPTVRRPHASPLAGSATGRLATTLPPPPTDPRRGPPPADGLRPFGLHPRQGPSSRQAAPSLSPSLFLLPWLPWWEQKERDRG